MVHDDQFVQAQKRLYMTATPRIYAETSKRKAADSSVVLYSMDDETIFGPEFHRLTFSEAVEADILSDYKVIILTVDEAEAFALFGDDIHDEKKLEAKLTDEAKIIGCLRAFAKRFPQEDDDDLDTAPMQRVVAFTNSIHDSQRVTHLLNQATPHLPSNPGDLLPAAAQHVDGSMNVANRNAALSWLKGRTEDGTCRVLSNARCLTEGVDVPSLDAVVFLQPRDSQVDVVQAVGRVMRKAPGKQFGYVVLPVVLPAAMQPEDLLEDRKEYRVVWQVLNALRSHDDHFNDLINHLEFNQKSRKVRIIGKPSSRPDQMQFQWTPQELQRVFYAKLVKKVGDREYWDEWARKVAHIADRYRIHITDILSRSDPKAQAAQTAFTQFLAGLRDNVNDQITRDEALDMLAQHLVTQPVFDALFADYAFTQHNPVSQSMEQVLAAFHAHALGKEKESVTKLEGKVLDQLHGEISRQAGGIETAEGKQRFLIKIYDKFFRIALQKTAERLGIVYTPIEIVDFILQSVEAVLEDEFGQRLTDEQVHILDPFTGTGTFLVRLMLSGLIRPEDVVRKYRHELHANEIVLLAYYLAAINIEQTFHAVSGQAYEPFPGIVLTDTFQQGESRKDFMGQETFPENNDRLIRQNQTEIRVIVGNPPYSVGQDNANDNNQNIKYPVLDDRIRDTYAAHSTAVNKNSLYDSYIRAFRWASDRIGRQGVIGFVTNAGWVDGNTMDGFRHILTDEFTDLYVFHLRGNQRTSGELSRREGGKIFGSGSRAPIAITILVKNRQKRGHSGRIHFHAMEDYLSRNEKLAKLANSVNIRGLEWTRIRPNAQQDWLNQRSDDFQSLVALGSRDTQEHSIFSFYSNGVQTNRDAWVYNFDSEALRTHMQATIAFYNDQVTAHRGILSGVVGEEAASLAATLVDTNPRAIKWTRGLIKTLALGKHGKFADSDMGEGVYRPFCKQWVYYNKQFNEYYKERFYPTVHHPNRAIAVTGTGSTKDFSCLIVDKLPDLEVISKGQCFPWSVYEKKSGSVTPDFFDETHREEFTRYDGITDWALHECRVRYGPSVNKEDIFYYVYGLLHAPDYRRFAADLKKMLPRIPFVERQEDFWAFSQAGRKLAHWHLDYETVEPWELTEQTPREEEVAAATYRVQKMRWGKNPDGAVDKTVIHYNADITLEGIPLEAYDYVVNGKSALEWVMERYQVKTDKDSGILNDPNAWSDDPRYILDLVKRVVRVSMETLRIVGELPRLEFDT